MSVCFNNIMIAAEALASIPAVPSESGREFFNQLANLSLWDKARKSYYAWDEESLKVFDWIQQYRAIMTFYGNPLPVTLQNTPFPEPAWAKLEEQAKAMTAGFASGDYLLDRIDTWLLESYTLPGHCEVEPGDLVLDCGAYSGNTSLYFADRTGPDGRVYGFEAAPSTFARYSDNMSGLANVVPVHAAVCDLSGTVSFSGDSFDAAIDLNGQHVPALRLDDFCQQHALDRVDFVKMDVEGAEARALAGAEELIRRFRPKMAISAYHRENDLLRLPRIILDYNPDYRFSLRHFSNSINETVLYCIPGARPEAQNAPRTDDPDLIPPAPEHLAELLFLLMPFFRRNSEELHNVSLKLKKMHWRDFGQVNKQMASSLELINRLADENQQLHAENISLRRILNPQPDRRAQ